MKKHIRHQLVLLVLLGISPSCSPDDTDDSGGHGSVGNEPATGGYGNGAGGTGSSSIGGASNCIVNNLVCKESTECCSGYCDIALHATNGLCRPDPAGIGSSGECLPYDSGCLYTEECCEGSCTLGFCSVFAGCRILGSSCTGRDVCCAGLVCQNRYCVSETAVTTGGSSSGGNTSVGTGGSAMVLTCVPQGQSCAGSLSSACCTGLTCVNSICTSAI